MGNSSSAADGNAAAPSSTSAGSRTDADVATSRSAGASVRDESTIDTDITVFGATGFVARHVCNYLVASANASASASTAKATRSGDSTSEAGAAAAGVEEIDDTDYDAVKAETTPDRVDNKPDYEERGKTASAPSAALRLTLAGRNESKLREVLDKLTSLPEYSPQSIKIDVFVADADDVDALKAMAARTRVVLNTAGPFSRYGTNVVAACSSTGADYVDITGEVGWAGEMRTRFGDSAAKSGARIVSFCGFDSIPSDLAVYGAVRSLREARTKKKDDEQEEEAAATQIIQAKCWHSCFGGANGGTIATAINIPVDVNHMLFDDSTGKLRPVPFLMDDPFELVAPTKKNDPRINTWRYKAALAEWRNQCITLDTELSDFGATVSAPFFMGVCNAKIVHASAVALNYYSPDNDVEPFTYWERFLPAGLDLTRYLNVLSVIPALSYSLALAAITATLKIPVVGQKLVDLVVPPGTGTPDWVNEMGYSDVYAEALSPSAGEPADKNLVDRGTCRLRFEGDPGNLVTAQCVSEAALALVHNREELPSNSEDGFGTPAQLLGDTLLSRLVSSDVRKVTMETTVVEKDRRYKWERIGTVVAIAGAVGYAISCFW
mmetsp:Transcript_3617/g.7879  ORF Transcript_3617/g.7879 Transcript_3617/m.7879 type:complete len:608 (+) Transcript_3617:122-1945(+)